MLTLKDMEEIVQSLNSTLYNVREYVEYPSHELKQNRMKEIHDALAHAKAYRNELQQKGDK